MLVPAQLYKEEIKRALVSKWYDPKYQFYFGGEFFEHQVPDNLKYRREFAHLDSDGNPDGFFAFAYNQDARSMCNFGLISFSGDGTPLIFESLEVVKRMFREGAQRAEFWAFEDNPAVKLYDFLIQRFCGKRCGRLHRTAFFGGEYHNTIFYEVLVENIPPHLLKKD